MLALKSFSPGCQLEQQPPDAIAEVFRQSLAREIGSYSTPLGECIVTGLHVWDAVVRSSKRVNSAWEDTRLELLRTARWLAIALAVVVGLGAACVMTITHFPSSTLLRWAILSVFGLALCVLAWRLVEFKRISQWRRYYFHTQRNWDDYHNQASQSVYEIAETLIVDGFPFDRLDSSATRGVVERVAPLLDLWVTWRLLDKNSGLVVEPRLVELIRGFKDFTQEEKSQVEAKLKTCGVYAAFQVPSFHASRLKDDYERLSRYTSKLEDILCHLRHRHDHGYCLSAEGRWLANHLLHKLPCSEGCCGLDSDLGVGVSASAVV